MFKFAYNNGGVLGVNIDIHGSMTIHGSVINWFRWFIVDIVVELV